MWTSLTQNRAGLTAFSRFAYTTGMRNLTWLCCGLLALPIAAQGEEEFVAFEGATEAFARAAKVGKRVLLYQDWPG